MSRDVGKYWVAKAIAVKVRRSRLTQLWNRALNSGFQSMSDVRRCDAFYREMKKADFDNETCNSLCGPRYALVACRIASRVIERRRASNPQPQRSAGRGSQP